MKRWHIFLLSLLVFLQLALPSNALNNSIDGNAKIAGMGFSQVSNNSSFIANPASFDDSKISFTMANTELFASGVMYNYFEGGFRFNNNWKLNLGFQSVLDRDKIDNSGYSQKELVIGVANKLKEQFQVGVSISRAAYGLFDESIGSGFGLNAGMFYGPFSMSNYEIRLAFMVDNLVASRDYKTDRNEIPKAEVSAGLNVGNNNYLYVMDLKRDDFRCGFEYRVMPYLVLRGGLKNGEPTLGVGISQGLIHIDYAYWLSEIGATHRIGSSISF